MISRACIWFSSCAAFAIVSQVNGQTLFSENYASGATSTTSLVPAMVVDDQGRTATPVFEIEPMIVNPDFNGGANFGPNVLTLDAGMPNPNGASEGLSIGFTDNAHPDDPGTQTEITNRSGWQSDTPKSLWHPVLSKSLSPQLSTRDKVYVLDFSVGSNLAFDSTDSISARIGLFDDKDQGVFFGQNFNTKAAGNRFARHNFLNVHRVNAEGENVHIDLAENGGFSSGHKNLSYGATSTIPSAPQIDFGPPFRVINQVQDDSGILGHLFESEGVIRVRELDYGRMNIEWFSAESVPANPSDINSTPFGGDVGTRPERDGWHNYTVLENIFDLSGADKVPLGDLTNLRIALWNLKGYTPDSPNASRNLVVSNLDEMDLSSLTTLDRSTSDFQLGYGRIIVQEYHSGDINRDGNVTADDLLTSGMLEQINTFDGNRVWKDGDVTGDKNVSVGDALGGVLEHIGGAAPNGPELIYNTNGNLTINTNGASISGFALVAAPNGSQFFTGQYNFNAPASTLETVRFTELSWLNLGSDGTPGSSGNNLTGTINLGNVMPTGLTEDEVEAFFLDAVFNVNDPLSKAASFFAVPLAGDYNDDGVVNLADYTVWRDALGGNASLPNDLIGGTVGVAQYNQWKANFGGAAPISAATSTTPTPEPSTVALILLCVLPLACRSRTALL